MTRPLGAFLRAQRERLHPTDVGLPARERRRTPGLRREDVAGRAGVSVDYYARLEQGRGLHPTPQVLDALARALLLTDAERIYLHRLARRGAEPAEATAVSPRTRALLDTFGHAPAYVVDARLDVLAWNPLADALLELERRPADERNLIWLLFCDSSASTVIDPDDSAALGVSLVAQLRARNASNPDDHRLLELVERVSARSPAFRAAWNDQVVDDAGAAPSASITRWSARSGWTTNASRCPTPASP